MCYLLNQVNPKTSYINIKIYRVCCHTMNILCNLIKSFKSNTPLLINYTYLYLSQKIIITDHDLTFITKFKNIVMSIHFISKTFQSIKIVCKIPTLTVNVL